MISERSLLIFLAFGPLIFTIAMEERDLPRTRVIEINSVETTKDHPGRVSKVVNKKPNSDLILGEDISTSSMLVFECSAAYPVQWTYSGDGMPEYSTNTSVDRTPEPYKRPIGRAKFMASASLGFQRPLGVEDAGRYTCRSLQDPDISVFYNFFAGNTENSTSTTQLFMNKGGEKITYRKTDSVIRLPCAVNDPRTKVSLQKSVNGLVQCPMNDSISFEPDKGFFLKVSLLSDVPGTYVCTAGINNTFQVVEYTVEEIEPVKNWCARDEDCPRNEECIRNECRSYCRQECGVNAECRKVSVRYPAQCVCFEGYEGNPYAQCRRRESPAPKPDSLRDLCNPSPCGLNSVCKVTSGAFVSCACQLGYFGQPPNCRPECEYNSDCPYHLACISLRCRNPCDGACDSFPTRECRVINRQPVCSLCPSGSAGRRCQSEFIRADAAELLEKHSIATILNDDAQSIELTSPNVTVSSSTTTSPMTTDISNSFAENRTTTMPPVVTEDIKNPCNPSPCGKFATCRLRVSLNSVYNTTSEVAVCECPPGTVGDAYEECGLPPVTTELNDTTTISYETHWSQDGSRQSPLNCKPKCGEDAICTADNRCVCAENYEGNPYQKCENKSCQSNQDCNTNSLCIEKKCIKKPATVTLVRKKCGINAASTTTNGKSICRCLDGYSGLASIECRPVLAVVRQNASLEDPCDKNPCGGNAQCVSKNGIAVCECIRPFQGNPLVGCELSCTQDNDCPETHTCFDKSKTCIDPCHKDHQHFFTECGRNAKCKVVSHTPTCYCPSEVPYGSPHIHCKEKSWMPDHALFHIPCEKSDANCGDNAICHGLPGCRCLPGFYGDPYGKPGCQPGIECHINNQCLPEKECVNGKCLDPCRRMHSSVICGQNAGCRGENHQAICTCNIGAIRNPSGECEVVTGALAARLFLYRSFEDIDR